MFLAASHASSAQECHVAERQQFEGIAVRSLGEMTQQSGSDSRIWITRFVDGARSRLVDRPILVSVATLGLVPVVLSLGSFGLVSAALPPEFVVTHGLAALVSVVAPAAIWYWDSRVFPRFASKTKDIAVDPAAVDEATTRYKRVFSRQYQWFTVPWTVLIVGVVALNAPYFRSLGFGGLDAPAFWVYLLFATWWGLVTGIGFHGAITAIRAIRAVGALDLEIDPLQPDGLGGLSSVGYLAIRTTMLISFGSLAVPYGVLLGTEGGYGGLIYFAVGLYVVLIAVSFAYPTVYVNRRAQAIREAELEERRAKIRRLQAQANDLATESGEADGAAAMNEVAKRLEIQRLRDEFVEYQDVNLYPLSVGIIARLVSSILLPLFFAAFQVVLGDVI
jgi:hypothetical protein